MVGCIKPAKSLILRESVGTADDDDGNKYEMSVAVGGMCPVVHSKKSGKYFVLAWQDILALAIAAGVDECSDKEPV